MKISKINAIQILDSRGNPTLKAFVQLENGIIGSACVPSGASTGKYEAVELRDGDKTKYLGRGVTKAAANVNGIINDNLKGMAIADPASLDKKMIELDGTENKSALGANAILSVSLGCCRALALLESKPLFAILNKIYFSGRKTKFPRLMANVINGGRHANWNFDIQEFMISPISNKPSESVRIAAEIFHHLENILKEKGLSTLVGDEGGLSPLLNSNDEVFEVIIEAMKKAGYATNQDVNLAIDVAASEFFQNGSYHLKKQNKNLSVDELVDYYLNLNEKYKIFSYEDPFDQDDWDGFAKLTKALGNHALTVGDDLYCTNPKRIKKGISEKTTNAILIKLNQIGTMSETATAINLSYENGLKVIISHRSGETEDAFIADLAVAAGADFIKAGSMSRSDRLAKYNRLIEIEANEL